MSEKSKNPGKGSEEPNLELPGFKLGRRRKQRPGGEHTAAGARPADAPEVGAEKAAHVSQQAPHSRVMPARDPEPPRKDTRAALPRLPRLPGPLAAVLTGALMGLLGVGLAWLSAQGCEAVRGVGSCGGFGLFALIAILGIEVLLGAALLRACRSTDPVSTSFLGVGLVAVIAMLFFLDSIESRWMLLVIPALTALTYLASWWVVEALIADKPDPASTPEKTSPKTGP